MLGLHPWFVAETSREWLPRLESLLRSHSAGVGECGLDFARDDTDRASQEAAFRTQLRLAHTLHRPVALHVVRAWGRVIDLLREEGVPPAGTMIHAYAGSPDTARSLYRRGIIPGLKLGHRTLRFEYGQVIEALRQAGDPAAATIPAHN